MNLLFWVYKSRIEKSGQAFIMARITHHSKRANINTGLKILPNTWDSKKQRVKGNSELAINVNRHIQTISVQLLSIYDELSKTGKDFTVLTLREKFQFKGEQHYTLMEVVKQHILKHFRVLTSLHGMQEVDGSTPLLSSALNRVCNKVFDN